MERPVRNALLLKYVPEGPVAVSVRHIAQAGQESGAGDRVQVRVMNRTEGIVTCIELGNIHRYPFVFGEGINDVPAFPHFRDQDLRIVPGSIPSGRAGITFDSG